jgi:hypothetical protein
MHLKITLSLMVLIIFIGSCNLKQRMKNSNKAQNDADYIIEHLNKKEVISHLPATYFSRDQSENLIQKISESCDWENRKGNFVDYTTIQNNSEHDIAFIYEYFLKCDSLRFILIYNIDKEEPKLFKINIEPLSKQSPMVIHPEKQLLKYK